MATFELPFHVELWDRADSRVEELLAACANVLIARAAFNEAVRRHPGRRVYMRLACRVIARSAEPQS